jgi:hypothetical protein
MHSHGNRSAALFANIRRIKESAKEKKRRRVLTFSKNNVNRKLILRVYT